MKNISQFLSSMAVICLVAGLFGTHLNAQENLSWHEKVIHVKLTEVAQAQLLFEESGGLALTGIESLDALYNQLQVTEMEQAIRTDPRFAQRHAQFGLNRWFRLRYEGNFTEAEAAAMFSENELIEVAERRYKYTMPEVVKAPLENIESGVNGTNDPLIGVQWALHNTGQQNGTPGADINIFTAWGITTGNPDVIVMVIDSGIDVNHPDLAGNLWVNPNPGSENGYDGDIHGWNFFTNTNQIQDQSGHGTHVSGSIAAITNNEIGIAGVAGGFGELPGVRIMTANVNNPATGLFEGNIPEAFVYASDNGAVIVNNSWGGGGFSQLILDAVNYFIETAGYDADGSADGPIQGGVVVFSAGNGNTNLPLFPLSDITDVLAVASTDRNDVRSSFSHYGGWVHVSAPGSDIVSTHLNGSYMGLSGTSMAAPHISGVAALIASHLPGLTYSEVKARIMSGVDNISDSNPDYIGMLGGRINALSALIMENNDIPPMAIHDLQTTGHISEDHVFMQFTVPETGGTIGKAYAYDIRISEQPISADNFNEAQKINESPHPWFPGMIQQFRISGLVAQSTYYVAMTTRDAFGNISEISNIVSFTTDGSPVLQLSEEVVFAELRFGETSIQTTEITNTGEGKLFFSFPFYYQESLSVTDAQSPLRSFAEESTVPAIFSDPLARSVITNYRKGSGSSLNGAEQSVLEAYLKMVYASASHAGGINQSSFSSSITFQNLQVMSYQLIRVAEGIYFGDLVEVIPDFVLNGNNSGSFYASDLALIFVDPNSTGGNPFLLQIGGYAAFAPTVIPWQTGDSEVIGTRVTGSIPIDFSFPVDGLDVYLVNSYFAGSGLSAVWSGDIELVGVNEQPRFITAVTPASGSLLPGETAEITLTMKANSTGNLENAVALRSNHLAAPVRFIMAELNVSKNISWVNLAGPAGHTMTAGDSVYITAYVFAEGITDTEEADTEIVFYTGFHHENTDPATWPEEAWAEGTFDEAISGTHRYSVTTGSHLPQGTWYYATRFNYLNEGFTYGGYSENGGGIWDGESNKSGILNILQDVSTPAEPELPRNMILSQNYPNPFNPNTIIRFGLPAQTDVRLDVYNINGQRVVTLVNGTMSAGYHTVTFSAGNLSSGVYMYRLFSRETGDVFVRKMTLIK